VDPAKLEGGEGDEQFWFEGGSDADRRVRVESKERGFKICRGTVRHHLRSLATFDPPSRVGMLARAFKR
jgi:hypothetical protein